ncbi:MAG: FlgD immunoglobulin-like domain containing protein, partial [Calditrichia bacterium]
MKSYQLFSILFLLLFCFSFASASQKTDVKAVQTQQADFNHSLQQDIPYYLPDVTGIDAVQQDTNYLWLEDFEGGAPGWFTVDETDAGVFWHRDDWMAYGGSGVSWWMADTTLGNNGGYLSHWYQVLDTDPFVVSGNAQLTFYQRLAVEDPAGATPPYDGWDGVNVRISTDNGVTWTVLTSPTPAYNATSLYSFGFEFNEGPGVPGWGGVITPWEMTTIDLSAYTGQTVQIRFAFASDPGYDTSDDPTLFGWQIDEIEVADGGTVSFYNDGSQNNMTPSSNATAGGDYWHLETSANAPSPTHYYDASDSTTGSYHPNMQASLISPYFWVPDTTVTGQVFLDFYLQGTYDDNDAFPNVDYFGAYVQVKGENVWRYVSNITMDPNGSNFVYSSAPPTWQKFSETYSVGNVDMAPLAGDSVRVKFTFFSDEDTPIGSAIQIDDVFLWTPPLQLTGPFGLMAFGGSGYVKLAWEDLDVSGQEQIIYDDGSFEDAIHLGSGSGWAGEYVAGPVPGTVDTVWVYGANALDTNMITISLFEVQNGIINSSPAYTKDVSILPDQWNVYDLSAENWMVDGDFLIAQTISVPVYVALDVNATPSSHSYVNLGGWSSWRSVASGAGLPDGEWGIRASVNFAGSADFTYNVYRKLSTDPDYSTPLVSNIDAPYYVDTSVMNGETYCYVVTANYPGNEESAFSNEACAMPQSATVYEISYDDGAVDSFYTAASGEFLAVKFGLDSYPQDVIGASYFFNSGGGAFQLYVWDDDGANGEPGTVLYFTSIPSVDAGWNTFPIPAQTITSDSFYVGLRVAPTTPDIGVDETAPLDMHSYMKAGANPWTMFTLGDLMIRAQVDAGELAYTMDIINSWNLVGLPLIPPSTYYKDVFPNSIDNTLFKWVGSYSPEDSMEAGVGYWLRFPAPENPTVTGQPIGAVVVDLITGWNMFAGPSCNVPVSNILDPSGAIIPGTVFGYAGAYSPADTIEQGSGYWVRASSPGQITLLCNGSNNAVLAKGIDQLPDVSGYAALNISDALGASQTLHYGVKLEDENQLISFSMPPLPPAGAFDARFSGDYRISQADEAVIQIQSASYPVTIKAENLDAGETVTLTEILPDGEGNSYTLTSGETARISNNRVASLRLSKISTVPTVFAVQQNYPNPFNPTTEIQYSIPQDVKVEIGVYNSLGQKVKTLLSGNQKAGHYRISWDGTNDNGQRVASGIHFLRVKAGNNVAVRKMMLLK